jgi:small-conductance mechanosensitive channel
MKKKTELITYGSLLAVFIITGTILWSRFADTIRNYVQEQQNELMTSLLQYAPRIIIVITLFFVFKLISILVLELFFRRLLGKRDQREGVIKFTRFILWTGYVFVSLSVLFNNFTGLLTSVGLIGFGLTFALQKPISNFMGWLTLIMKGIYKEGDRIEIQGIRGDVKEIQMMNTILENLLDGTDIKNRKIVTFPNDYVLTHEVKNYTQGENYILDELKIDITYESDYRKAIDILGKIVKKHISENKDSYISEMKKREKTKAAKKNKEQEIEALEDEFQPKIRVEFEASAIQLICHFLTPYDQIKAYRTAINIAFLDAIAKEKKIEIAYPHIQVVRN